MNALPLTTQIEQVHILFVLGLSTLRPLTSIYRPLCVSQCGVGLLQKCVDLGHWSRGLLVAFPDLSLVSPMFCKRLGLFCVSKRPAALCRLL